jgi:putative ABC transport system permease protein
MQLPTELSAAFRQLRRSPGFSSLAIAMLALGIGANVAIFSIFQSIVLNPLPFAAPGRLVGLSAVNSAKALTMPAISPSDFRDLHERAKSYAQLGAYRPDFTSYVPAGGGDPVQLIAANVTEELFPVLGVAPVAGRVFTGEEFSAGGPRAAILSFRAWRRHFAERAGVVGETILLNDVPTTVIGIMPDGFREPEFVDVWLPCPQESPEYFARDSRFWTTIGRLKDGVTPAAAQAEATTIADALAREYPSTNRGWTMTLQPLLEQRVGSMRNSLLLLVGAVALVLLVACINLANLMLARGVSRLPELAARLALGATSQRLARAVFLESLLLAVLGGGLGAGLAAGGLPLLARSLPAGLVPRSQSIGVDGTALAFALGVSVLTGIVFGLLPAWQVLRANVNELLKSGGARGGTSRFTVRAQTALIVGQVALTLTVLSGAGLLVKSLLNLQHTPLGFDPRDVLTVRVSPPQSRWDTFEELANYYDRLATEVRQLPGVDAVAMDCSAPLSGISLRYPFWVQGRPRAEGSSDEAVFHAVGPDYLSALKLPLVRGRFFTAHDDRKGRAVCVINQALAQRLFPNIDPIGQRIQTVVWLNKEYREIVGVVGDTKQVNLSDPMSAGIYVPQQQSPWFFTTLLVRIKGGAAQTGAVQAALRRADPTLTMTIRSLEDNIALTSTQPRLRTLLFGLFAALALGLSAFGIYASMAFTVSQRTREIGVRMALGATPREILGWVLARAGRLCALGIAAGLVGAVTLGWLLRGLLHGVEPTDPAILAGLAVFLPVVVFLASAQPAWSASRLNPTQALQQE